MSSCCHCQTNLESDSAGDERTGDWMRMVFAALVAAQSMIFGLAVSITPPEGTARFVIHLALAVSAVVVFLLVGLPVLRSAFHAACQGKVVIEQLFLAGIFGAFFASVHCTLTGTGHVYYEVVAILLAIYTFGQIIGESRRAAARDAARELGSEFSLCEKVGEDGESIPVAVTEISPGDRVRVPSGGAIPVDGVIEDGIAFVRESALTGEAFPVVKRPGDVVRAGSHSLDQALEIRVTAGGGERALDRLLESVRAAQDSKCHLQKEADRLVSWFLPAVLIVAVLTFLGWTWAVGWQIGLFNALAVLVVACPCSMGLATPIGIWAALSSLARRGIIAKDSELIETLGKVDTVVFDKTGTLGDDRLDLVDFVVKEGADRGKMLQRVAALESTSGHPVAMGFRKFHSGTMARQARPLPGVGISGEVDGHQLEVGNSGLLERADAVGKLEMLLRDSGQGSHRVWVRQDGELIGLGILREQLRASSRAALELLETMGVRSLVMTGDRPEAAAVHGFTEVHAGLQPEEKAARVAALRREGAKVLFVGDGVNDAPAMAEADAAIAMEGGSALASASAGAELLGEDISSIPAAIARCRRTLHAIRANLLFAACYNVVGISLAAAGIIHPVVAALLMLASSLTVTWQALREAQQDEVPAMSKPVRKRSKLSNGVGLPFLFLSRWFRFALFLGVAVQGLVIAYLGGFTAWSSLGVVLVFLAGALVFFYLFTSRPATSASGMAASMFSFGGLAMLLGWWVDAGFGAVVRDGVCLCGCVDSSMGWGLWLRPNWMLGGMLLGAIPAFYFEEGRSGEGRLPCWLAGVVGMIVGMELAALLMALLPVREAIAGFHFFATYGAMVFGMSLGMLVACHLFRNLPLPWRAPVSV